MTDLPPVPPPADEPPREHTHPHEESSALPAWVPAAIGIVLVTLAGLAVYTGLRYRNSTLTTTVVRPRRPSRQMTGNGPPGEPEPGASLVFPGESADNAPTASAPVTGRARAEISGGAAGVTTTVRLWARRGMMTNVVPPDAMVYVNNLPIGQANQFNSENEIYDFPAPGSYTVRFSAPGYRDQQFIITAAENAKDEIARIDVKLVKAR
jgi:hypothetical protein